MNKPQVYKITGFVRVTIEVIAADDESAEKQFYAAQLSDFDLKEIELIELEHLGEHYAD
jgi:hypothetical protein